MGLAGRDTIADFFESIARSADGTYTVGDCVVLEDGTAGGVADVTIRNTVVPARDDILRTVPNSALETSAVVNESAPRTHRRLTIPVSVASGADLDAVKPLMLDVAAADDRGRPEPDQRVRLRAVGEAGLKPELRWCTDDPRHRGRITDRLLRAVYAAFQQVNVETPYPQRDLRMRKGSGGSIVQVAPTPAPNRVGTASERPGVRKRVRPQSPSGYR